MAIQLSVTQSSATGELLVYADNSNGDHVAIIDNIILTVDLPGIGAWNRWFYQDDFALGTDRVPTGWSGIIVETNYSSGPATAHATAEYWEVDQSVKSPPVNIS
jgi:hypothetical protein